MSAQNLMDKLRTSLTSIGYPPEVANLLFTEHHGKLYLSQPEDNTTVERLVNYMEHWARASRQNEKLVQLVNAQQAFIDSFKQIIDRQSSLIDQHQKVLEQIRNAPTA